jgi:phage shock protein A
MNNAERLEKAIAVAEEVCKEYDAACKVFAAAARTSRAAGKNKSAAARAAWEAACETYGSARDKLDKAQADYDVIMRKIKREKMQSAIPDAKTIAPKHASPRKNCQRKASPKVRVSLKKK